VPRELAAEDARQQIVEEQLFQEGLRLRPPTFSKMSERRLWTVYSDRFLWEEVVRTEWQKSAIYTPKIPGYLQPEATQMSPSGCL
jgi:hypothetical protein